jgi:hypothetical protein
MMNNRAGNIRTAALMGILLAVILGAVFSVILNDDARAVQIRNVWNGTTVFDGADTLTTADLTAGNTTAPVSNMSHALTLLYARGTAVTTGNDQNYLFTAMFEDNGTLLIERAGAQYSAAVSWFVAEFEDGVTIQRGLCSLQDAAISKDVDVNTFDINKTFIILNLRAPYSNQQYTENLMGTASFIGTNTSQIRISRGCRSVNTSQTYYYQIVEFKTDASIQNGTCQVPYNLTSNTTTISSVDINKSFLITQFRGDSATLLGNEQHFMIGGTFTDDHTLAFYKKGNSTQATDNVTVQYYVVTLSDPVSQVWNGITNWTNTTGNHSLPETNITDISSYGIDTKRSLPFVSSMGGARGAASWTGGGSWDDSLDDVLVAVNVTATNMTLSRLGINNSTCSGNLSYSGCSGSTYWFLAEFAPLTIKEPTNASLVWRVGETKQITWKHATSIGAHNVSIYVSRDNGGNWTILQNDTNGDGVAESNATNINASWDAYNWTIPNCALNNASRNFILDPAGVANIRINITDTNLSARHYTYSNNPFEIKGSVHVNIPNGTEDWELGEAHNISWNKTGDLSAKNWTIALSPDGSNWTNLTNNYGGANVSWNWSLVDTTTTGTAMRVRVSWNGDPLNVTDTSNTFAIRAKLNITRPDATNATSGWLSQVNNTIEWTRNGSWSGDKVKLMYSVAGGEWQLINNSTAANISGNPNYGNYTWEVPKEAISTNTTRIYIENKVDTAVNDTSDTFTVYPYLMVTNPNDAGVAWNETSSQYINWSIWGSMSTVDVWYSKDNATWTKIKANNASGSGSNPTNGSFLWDGIPSTAIGESIALAVSASTGGGAPVAPSDTSNNTISIRGLIAVDRPGAGASNNTFYIDQNEPINWTTNITGGETVTIQFARYGVFTDAPNLTVINSSTLASAKTYTWKTLDKTTSSGLVRVIWNGASTTYGESSPAFSVKGKLNITTPNSGTYWVGDAVNITWQNNGSITLVNINYSANNGSDGYPYSIAEDQGQNGTFVWNVSSTAQLGDQIRIIVYNKADLSVNDTSAGPLTLRGMVNVTRPNGTETWNIGDKENITWTRNGDNLGNISITWYSNSTPSYNGTVIGSCNSSVLKYEWTVGNVTAVNSSRKLNDLKIKVAAVSDPINISNVSAGGLYIVPNITVTRPGGANGTFFVKNIENLTWTTAGALAKVNIYYSNNSSAGPWELVQENYTNLGY